MASNVESKCKVRIWTSNQVSKDLKLTMANYTMSKNIDKMRTTVKDQQMFGRATSLKKKEASDEIATSLERRSKSELEIVEVVCLDQSRNEIKIVCLS